MSKQLGMVIDLKACIGCHACSVACSFENGLETDVNWHRVETIGDPKAGIGQDIPIGEFPNLGMYWLPMPCMHCENPPCLEVCPAMAISKRDAWGGVDRPRQVHRLQVLQLGMPLRRAGVQRTIGTYDQVYVV